jgi:hypothetical protein
MLNHSFGSGTVFAIPIKCIAQCYAGVQGSQHSGVDIGPDYTSDEHSDR